jgi:hypothetical protein
MVTFLAILAPMAGVVGALLGVLLNEFVRRKNRRELYAPKIFEKRLAAYESLAELIENGSGVANEVIENPNLTYEQRHDLIAAVVMSNAKLLDKNRLYIDEEIGAHCVALFMGVEDIYGSKNVERERLLKNYHTLRSEALRMIREDSGVAEINKLFRTINRSKLGGPIVEAIRELRQKQHRTR